MGLSAVSSNILSAHPWQGDNTPAQKCFTLTLCSVVTQTKCNTLHPVRRWSNFNQFQKQLVTSFRCVIQCEFGLLPCVWSLSRSFSQHFPNPSTALALLRQTPFVRLTPPWCRYFALQYSHPSLTDVTVHNDFSVPSPKASLSTPGQQHLFVSAMTAQLLFQLCLPVLPSCYRETRCYSKVTSLCVISALFLISMGNRSLGTGIWKTIINVTESEMANF